MYEGEGMRGLTLYQPWATLVAIKAKRIETRPRRISYRGPIAIHAASTWHAGLADLCYLEPFFSAFVTRCPEMRRGDNLNLPLGNFVAIAFLADCIKITADNAPAEPERSFGDYRPGRWMWILDDIRALPKPIPCRGMQGLWRVPDDVLTKMVDMGMGVGA